MSELPKIVRARLKAEAPGDHPDPNLLAAFAEQALPDLERAPILLHLSRCADCRDVLALALPPAHAATAALDTDSRVRVFRWSILRWGAVAACVVIVGSAVLMKRETFVMHRAGQAVATRSEEEFEIQDQQSSAPLPAPLPPSRDETLAAGDHEQAFASSDAGLDATKKTKAAVPKTKALQSTAPKALVPAPGFTASRSSATGYGAGALHGSIGAAGGIGAGATHGAAAYAFRSNPAAPGKPASPMAGDKALPAVGGSFTGMNVPSQASQTVEVEGQAPTTEVVADAPPTEKQETPGRAKSAALPPAAPPPPPTARPQASYVENADSTAHLPSAENVTTNRAEMAKEATSANRERKLPSYAPVSRWTISSDGQLEHSIDSGKTWQPVTVADNATFRALSANGPDLWVGGAAGLLYHSPDAGGHWTRVKPAVGGTSLTADIAAIEFTDARQGKVTASNGEVWLTDDAGQSWRKQ